MVDPIKIREDFDSDTLRRRARESQNPKQVRRLLAIAAIYEGASRTDAAKIGGVTPQVLRDWVVRFNAEGFEGLTDRKAPGKTPALNAEQRLALAKAVENEANPYLCGERRWRLCDLTLLLRDRFEVAVSEATVGRELHALGFRKLQPPQCYLDHCLDHLLNDIDTVRSHGGWARGRGEPDASGQGESNGSSKPQRARRVT